ncbi:MAG: hypothetical protein GXP04_11470, partial [Alphaproteobacteria bacterium]|nr:hypothetical protein [Alphaproteobacteria bacterium]
AKEVGFYYALNWSFATLFLMPAAWTLIYLALSGLRNAWADMASRRMLVTNNFTPVAADHPGFRTLQNHLRLFVVGGIVTVTTLMVVLSMSDHAQVAGQFYGDTGKTAKLDRIDAEGYALETANIERDWMVASFLSTPKPDKVEVNLNNAFSLTTYMIYVGFGIGSLFSFGLVMIGVGAAFMRGVAQNYGLQIIPSLASDDRRCGFEVMQRFFTYAYLVAFIGCVMIYLMGIQNIYLRSPDPNIFVFLAPDLTAFENPSNWRDRIDAAIGFLFSDNVAKGTRNAYAWIFGFFIFAIFIGGFMFFLRQGAAHGRRVVLTEIRSRGVLRLEALTNKDEQTVIAQLNKMRIWPLDQPSLKASLIIVGLLVASFIFYKLGVLIVLGLCVALPVHLWRSDRDAILISATADADSTSTLS